MGVPMPAPNYGSDTENRRRAMMVKEYGMATVLAAEASAVLDIFIKMGLLTMSEYADMVEYRCQLADRARQDQAARMTGK